jgi:probable F420-dependent oxidoreductase
MQIGAVFPQFEGAVDVGEITTFARAVEDMGYDYILMGDHVFGVELSQDNDWNGGAVVPLFRDPFVFCAFMAGVTRKIGFSTAITILPQRQTALVAKQAADLDELSGGRFRFGVGTGWNKAEYEALGVPFAARGQILEDQIDVLRALWTKPLVTLKTPYHTLNNAGLRPMPFQKPIPIWIGGADAHLPNVEKLLRRVARMADGWIPHLEPTDAGKQHIDRFHGYCREYGRDPAKIGIEAFISACRAKQDRWGDLVHTWRSFGISHVGVNTTEDNLVGVDQHLRRFEEFQKALG